MIVWILKNLTKLPREDKRGQIYSDRKRLDFEW